MTAILLVCLGGFFGAILRYQISLLLEKIKTPFRFPIGILLINWIGSGVLGAVYPRSGFVDSSWELFLITGLIGAFTTFSTFSMEALYLLQDRRFKEAMIYILASVIGSICLFAWSFYYASF